MPALNKQTLINLLIDSPLREPIKINLIDIVNNTNDVDLPKTYSTISKELEIFQKATERRMKLADETIAKLKDENGAAPATPTSPTSESVQSDSSLPPLPPLPTPPTTSSTQANSTTPMYNPTDPTGLSVPPLDLPPMPKMNTESAQAEPALPTTPAAIPEPPTTSPSAPADMSAAPSLQSAPTADADEDALKEIQKELDSLKSSAAEEAAPATPVVPAPAA